MKLKRSFADRVRHGCLILALAGGIVTSPAMDQVLDPGAGFNVSSAECFASSGDWLAVGMSVAVAEPGEFSTSGRVAMWKRVAGLWQLKQVLRSPNPFVGPEDYFGGKVVIDGDRMVVSSIEGLNHVHAFVRVGDTWTFDGRLTQPTLPQDVKGARYVLTCALSGNVAAVASGGSASGVEYSGWVDLFERQSTGWVHMTRLKDPVEYRRYGNFLAMSGQTLFVGMNTWGLPNMGGCVDVYDRSGSTWVKTRNLIVPGSYTGSPLRPIVAGNRLFGAHMKTVREYSLSPPYEPATLISQTESSWADIADMDARGDLMVQKVGSSDVDVYQRQPDQTWRKVQTIGLARHGLSALFQVHLTGSELIIGGYLPNTNRQIKSLPLLCPPQLDYSGAVTQVSHLAGLTTLDAGQYLAGSEVSSLLTFSAVQQGISPVGITVTATGDKADFSLSGTQASLLPGQPAAFTVGFKPLSLGQKRLQLAFTLDGSSIPVRTYEITVSVVESPTSMRFLEHPLGGLYLKHEAPGLHVRVSGTGPFTYRWFKDDVLMSGQNSSWLWTEESGVYRVEVTNPSGVLLSLPTPLGFYEIKTPYVWVAPGGSATLKLAVSSPHLQVQWMNAGLLLTDGPDVSGATTPELTVKNVRADVNATALLTMGSFGGPTGPSNRTVNLSVWVQRFSSTDLPFIIRMGPEQPVLRVGQEAAFDCFSDIQGPFTFRNLPPGLVGDAAGRVRGFPTQAGAYTFQVSLTSSANLTTTKAFTVTVLRDPPLPGAYWGWLEASEKRPQGGAVMLHVQPSGAFSGILQVGHIRTPFSGGLATNSTSQKVIAGPVSGRPSTYSLQAIGVAGVFDLLVRDGTGPVTRACEVRVISRPGQSLSTDVGAYTFGLLHPAGKAAEPLQGHGFGTLKIAADGRALLAGQLADGTSFTSATWLSNASAEPDGKPRLYFYHADPQSRTCLQGTACLRSDTAPADRLLSWERPPSRGRLLPRGFGPQDVLFIASRYSLPRSGGLLPGTSHQAIFSALNAAPAPTPFTLTRQHRAVFGTGTANPLKARLDLYAPTGYFTGQFTLRDPDPRNPTRLITRTVPYRGVFLPDQQRGVGYFLLPSLPDPDATPPTTVGTAPIVSGSVTIEAAP